MHQDPVSRPTEVAIVGAGFGGLCLAIKLLEAGIRDFVVLEKGEEVGGTWRDHTYPGAVCDLQLFDRRNVELVTEGIREITGQGIVTEDGVERPVDCIILGTGFVVDPRIYMRDFPITGLPGHALAEDWTSGAEAYYGISVSGYPNLQRLVGRNTALGHNSIIFMIEAQVRYVLECLRELKARGADYLVLDAAEQRRFNERVQQALKGTVWSSGCKSWYQSADGRNFTIWPWSTWRYWVETRKVRAERYRLARAAGQERVGASVSS